MNKGNCLFLLWMTIFMFQTHAQLPNVVSGKIERFADFNSAFIESRTIDVWLPENYSADKKYAVLYMHDGQMLYDATTTWNKQEWKVDETLSALMQEGLIQDCIVVGIYNTGTTRHSDYFPAKPIQYLPQDMRDTLIKNALQGKSRSDAYLKFIVTELKPFIDSTYATYSDQAHTFIAGSSMGGLISMYAICEYPETFGGAACLSTHWPGNMEINNPAIPEAFVQYLQSFLPNPANHKIYFDYGTATLDQYYEPFQLMVDEVMRKKQFNETQWKTMKFEGEEHSEASWSKRLGVPIRFLMGR